MSCDKFKMNESNNIIMSNKSNEIVELNILIADDNAINILLLQQHFDNISDNLNIKINTDIFTNGKEISDYYVSLGPDNDIDCIFMDISMPIMNGYRAGHIIHRHDPNIPIISISSNVISHEYKYIFTEMLERPVTSGQLKSIFLKLICNNNQESIETYINFGIVANLNSSNIKDILPILKKWKKITSEKIEELTYLLVNIDYLTSDFASISFIAHFIKGASYQIGCVKLCTLLKQLEDMSKNKKINECKILVDVIKECFNKTLIYINSAYNLKNDIL
jgi:CheY-like chemotaxis protein